MDVPDEFPERRHKSIRLVYACRLDARQKRVRDLVEIARLLDRVGTDVGMTLAGDGPERANLSRLIREYGLSSRVRLRGTASNADIVAMWTFGAILLPSAYEGKNSGV